MLFPTGRLSPCRVATLPTLSLAEARDESRVLEMFKSLETNKDIFQVGARSSVYARISDISYTFAPNMFFPGEEIAAWGSEALWCFSSGSRGVAGMFIDWMQDILRLYGTYRKPRYLLWAIMTALISVSAT